MPTNVPNYNPAINVYDSTYSPQLDPFSPQFDYSLVPADYFAYDNNYKYMFWKGWFEYLAGTHNRFWIMTHLI